MAFERRQSERFDIILVIEFRSLTKSLGYSPGVTRNFSHDGLSFEYHSCAIDAGEVLDFKLKHLHKQFSVSALGKIVWVKRSGFNCEAGIRFLAMNRDEKNRLMELTSMYEDIPWESFYYNRDSGSRTTGTVAETSVPDVDVSHGERLTGENRHAADEALSQSRCTENGATDDSKGDHSLTSAQDVPASIKGRKKGERSFASFAKVLAAIIVSIVIITFEDINIRIPEEEIIAGEEMKDETAETPAVADISREGPEQFQNAAPEEEQRSVAKREKLIEITISDDQLVSQPAYKDQGGSFFQIGRFVIAMGIADREPIGITNTFSALAGTVYCFLEARNITEDRTVNLLWYHEGKEMAKVELPLKKGERWRTYSSKRLDGIRGSWKVELQDNSKRVIEAITFTVD